MQLRDQITRPLRFDDEEEATSSVPRRRPPKCTTPAYPEILRSTTRLFSPALAPAAFPSLSLDGTCANYDRNHTLRDPPVPHASAATRISALPVRLPVQPLSNNSIIPDEMDVDFSHYGHNSSFVPLPHSSPTQAAQLLSEPVVRWHHLSEAIKLWIFDSVASFAPSQEVVRQRLGLSHVELDAITSESEKRRAHPHTTDEILAFCAAESSVGHDVWKDHEDYIAYAAKSEEATELEIQLGVLFLHQQNISDCIAQALAADLTEEPFINPGMLHADYTSSAALPTSDQASTVSNKDTQALGIVDVESQERSDVSLLHNLTDTASHFRSPYFPRRDRVRLLRKEQSTMSFIQMWFVYGTIDVSKTARNELVPDMLRRLKNNVLRVGHPVLQCLLILLCRVLRSTTFHGAVKTSQLVSGSLVDVWMYATSRYISMSRMIHTAVQRYDLKAWEKQRIITAACEEALRSIITHVRPKLEQYSMKQNPPQSAPPSSDAATLLGGDQTEQISACFGTPNQLVKKIGVRERRGISNLSPIRTANLTSSSSPLYSSRVGTPFLTIDNNGHASISEHSSDLDDSLPSSKRRRIGLYDSDILSTPSSAQWAAGTARISLSSCQSAWVDGPAPGADIFHCVDTFYPVIGVADTDPTQHPQLSSHQLAMARYPPVEYDSFAYPQTPSMLSIPTYFQTAYAQQRDAQQRATSQACLPFPLAARWPVRGEIQGPDRVHCEADHSGIIQPSARILSNTAGEEARNPSSLLQENTSSLAKRTFFPYEVTRQVQRAPTTHSHGDTGAYNKPVRQKRAYVKKSKPEPLQTGTPWLPDSMHRSRNRSMVEKSSLRDVATEVQAPPRPLQSLTPNRIQYSDHQSDSLQLTTLPLSYPGMNNATSIKSA